MESLFIAPSQVADRTPGMVPKWVDHRHSALRQKTAEKQGQAVKIDAARGELDKRRRAYEKGYREPSDPKRAHAYCAVRRLADEFRGAGIPLRRLTMLLLKYGRERVSHAIRQLGKVSVVNERVLIEPFPQPKLEIHEVIT